MCVEVSPSYDTVIGTSDILNPELLDFIKISVETPIPESVGTILSRISFPYARNPLCESVNFSFIDELVIFVMIFIPNFLVESGKKLIVEKEKEFISLMLITGQIKLLKKVSKILNLGHSGFYMKTEDRYFN